MEQWQCLNSIKNIDITSEGCKSQTVTDYSSGWGWTVASATPNLENWTKWQKAITVIGIHNRSNQGQNVETPLPFPHDLRFHPVNHFFLLIICSTQLPHRKLKIQLNLKLNKKNTQKQKQKKKEKTISAACCDHQTHPWVCGAFVAGWRWGGGGKKDVTPNRRQTDRPTLPTGNYVSLLHSPGRFPSWFSLSLSCDGSAR